ncbi:MAG: hypothetical protein G01um101456_749 [Parcubacteria group bacterium Gr01-1014_56]|nr:MAG: hypothetical protein G01um101456_749 [Parcubacteria group bacterium Gr01-1014_56]
MEWDKHQQFTRNSFCGHVYDIARETMRGLRTDSIGGIRYLPYWWLNGEVRVFWESGIPRQTVDLIVNAVDQRAREVPGLSFVFEKYGDDAGAIEQIGSALVRGQLDPDRLFSLALSEPWRDPRRGGRQHADIYITTKSFVDDPVSWAAASFKYGAMMFCLHGQRHHSHDFLRKVALHETNHLLGMYCHCDDYQNVVGLPYTSRCNMHYSCTHAELCPKCQTHIKWWWLGVQDEMSETQAEAS